MIRRPPRSTHCISSAASDVYKRQLHDYAHKEWNGLLKDFYYPRWKAFYDRLDSIVAGGKPEEIDWYEFEKEWAYERNIYPVKAFSSPVDGARKAFMMIFGEL